MILSHAYGRQQPFSYPSLIYDISISPPIFPTYPNHASYLPPMAYHFEVKIRMVNCQWHGMWFLPYFLSRLRKSY